MTDHDNLLTITEAAQLLRVPVATLRWWRHKGIGPRSFKMGRHVLYRHIDLEAFIEERLPLGDPDAA
jgi:excisionase family DNA binding protein